MSRTRRLPRVPSHEALVFGRHILAGYARMLEHPEEDTAEAKGLRDALATFRRMLRAKPTPGRWWCDGCRRTYAGARLHGHGLVCCPVGHYRLSPLDDAARAVCGLGPEPPRPRARRPSSASPNEQR